MVVVEISRANRTPGKVPALSIRFAELASLSQLPNPACTTAGLGEQQGYSKYLGS